MPRLVILPAAQADLVQIGDFIAQDNLGRALTFLAEIEAKMHQAAERPEMNAPRAFLRVTMCTRGCVQPGTDAI